MTLDLDKGGRAAIERMIDAYGCGTKTALAELLGISKGTLSNRYLRDTFPADYVIQCALETGVSLLWLATGHGPMYENNQTDILSLSRKKLIDGKLYESNFIMFDKAFLSSKLTDPIVISEDNITYVAEQKFDEVTDGKWLLSIDDKISIRDVGVLPGEKIRIENGKFSFECKLSDVSFLAKVDSITLKI
ncbi:phage repressor protein CI [Serratia bockelmannii]|uniref:phage repressor protein CI n=1 Tax=Serratia bockelmannii TaxID=2703793 RepID=UPI00313F1525